MERKYDIFISYRRDGGDSFGYLLYKKLTQKFGYRVFYDVESLRSGKFNDQLFNIMDECTDVILILSPNAWDRCVNEDDWVRKEIEHALQTKKNIIPVYLKGFEVPENIPKTIEKVLDYQGVNATLEYFDATIKKISFLIKAHKNIIDEKDENNIKTINNKEFQEFINSITEEEYKNTLKIVENKEYKEKYLLPDIFEVIEDNLNNENERLEKILLEIYQTLLLLYIIANNKKVYQFNTFLNNLTLTMIINLYKNEFLMKIFNENQKYKIEYMNQMTKETICMLDFITEKADKKGITHVREMLELNSEKLTIKNFRKIISEIEEDDYLLAKSEVEKRFTDKKEENKYELQLNRGLFNYYFQMAQISFGIDEEEAQIYIEFIKCLTILTHITQYKGMKIFLVYIYNISIQDCIKLNEYIDITEFQEFSPSGYNIEKYVENESNIEYFSNNKFLDMIPAENKTEYKIFRNILIHIEKLLEMEEENE